jgi:two-component system response regulator
MDRTILLVGDDPDDQFLTLMPLWKYRLSNEVVLAEDSAEALDYLFGRGPYARRETSDQPALVRLELRLPKVDV